MGAVAARVGIRGAALRQMVARANAQGSPLFLPLLATKPCFVKLASLAAALHARELPYLVVDAGQHYDDKLRGALHELGLAPRISVRLGARGDLLGRARLLTRGVRALSAALDEAGLRQAAVPLVSGDTSTAAIFPQLWYWHTGVRSVHVEAGLRSLAPELDWPNCGGADLLGQRDVHWASAVDDPFPEGVDTRLASVAAQLLLAPVARNRDALLAEGYPADDIRIVGSLSADAVRLVRETGAPGIFDRYPELRRGRWVRVDLHRRENMTRARLEAVLTGLGRFAARGGAGVVLVLTNALEDAVSRLGLAGVLEDATRRGRVQVQPLWPAYGDVVQFIESDRCAAIYTDSGGLQEEASVLGVPCITCRFSTDRPETVLDSRSNLLLPPSSADLVADGLELLTTGPRERFWSGLRGDPGPLYGRDVGEAIVTALEAHRWAPPIDGARAFR